MIVVFANVKINVSDVSKVFSGHSKRFKVSAVKNANGKILSGCVKITEFDKKGKKVSADDEDVDYVREKLEDALGEEILEIDDDDDLMFK